MTDSTSSSTQSDGTTSWELLDRYFAGECTPDETRIAERMIAAVPGGPALVLELRHGLRGQETRAFEVAERLTELRMRMMEDGGGAASAQVRAQSGWRGKVTLARPGLGTQTLRRLGWAAGLTAVIAGMLLLVRRVPAPHAGVTHVYATTAQQQATLNLEDGSRVTLAPQTTLRSLQVGAHSRTFVLDGGEAYFEVNHASGTPFVVRSGTATAQVLGTAFLIRHEAGDAHVRIAVADGKVRVTTTARAGTRGTGVTLTTGQVGDVTDSTTQVSTTDDLTPDMEWAPGRIMFRYTPLATVLQTVSRWYGYHFRYADSTLSKRSVTMIVSTRSSAEALATIERVLVVNLAVVGDTVTLIPKPPGSGRSAPRIRTYDVWTPTREVGR